MVKWFKDETELITGPSCMITLEKYSSSVELYSVGTLQSGIYSCQVSNEAGAVKSAAELLVKGWTILFSSTTTTTTQLTPSLFSIITAPLLHFCSLCLTTSSFRLLPGISISSSELPSIPYSIQSPVRILHISYWCSTVTLCLTIVTWSFFDFAEPPQFVLKLPPTTFVKLCEGHRFECKATSAHSLNMCWYKNDQKITTGNNYKIMFVDSTAYLQLRTTRFEDNGVYTCEAHNDAGSESCSSVLTVQGQLLNIYSIFNLGYTLLFCGFCTLWSCVAWKRKNENPLWCRFWYFVWSFMSSFGILSTSAWNQQPHLMFQMFALQCVG